MNRVKFLKSYFQWEFWKNSFGFLMLNWFLNFGHMNYCENPPQIFFVYYICGILCHICGATMPHMWDIYHICGIVCHKREFPNNPYTVKGKLLFIRGMVVLQFLYNYITALSSICKEIPVYSLCIIYLLEVLKARHEGICTRVARLTHQNMYHQKKS